MRKIAIVITGVLFAWLGGCAKYEPKPLTPAAVRRELALPDKQAILVAARSLKHPILKPVQLDFRRGLTPDQVAVVAVIVNPQLRAERDQRAIATAQVLQAGLLPNPQLTASVDVPHDADPADSFTAYGVGANWDITSLISHDARKRAAVGRAASVNLDLVWSEWQVAEAAKTAAYDVLSLTAQRNLAGQIDSQLARNFSVIRHAVDQHQKTLLDLSAAQVASQDAHAVVLSIQRDLTHARLVLNHAMGLPPGAKMSLRAVPLPTQLHPPTPGSLETDLSARRLDLLALKKGYDSEDQTLRAAILDQFPKINVGFNVAQDTSNVHTVGVGIGIDIPIFDRNQGQIAIEKATRQQLFDEYVNRLFDARSDIATASADIRSINAQIEADEAAIPELRRLVQVYRQALEQGNADILSFYSAQSEYEQKQMDVQKLKQELMENWIAIEIASGEYLPTGTASRAATTETVR